MFTRALRTVILFALVLPSLAHASDNPYLEALIGQARAMRLAENSVWRNLLHYKTYWLWPGGRSLADAPGFFNAVDGKTNPQSELEATLTSFFAPAAQNDAPQHPQCAFVARYRWLDENLHFDPMRLRPQACKAFDEWRTSLNPQGATLIFPTSFLNNPASMYGHTLLRIDAKSQDERTRLLAYAVNYAANTDETSGLVFAVKGLLGGYPGQFSIAPYYIKVREYNDIENRDIWEYELNLNQREIDRMVMHLWELGPVYFDYYFFDENCSYHLLSILEVARSGLELTDDFRWWAIPSDTVRAVTSQAGLLRRAVFRPASATMMRHRASLLSEIQRQMAEDLADRKIQAEDPRLTQLPESQRAAVIELGYDYFTYKSAGKEDTGGYGRELLMARSRLESGAPLAPVPVPDVRPDQGHSTARVALGLGREDGTKFVELRLRPAYHDLLDPEGGYTPGAQTEFFDVTLRRFEDESVKLWEFTPIDIVSLSPRDEFFKPVSWKINFGWKRKRLLDNRSALIFRLNGGPGLTWQVRTFADTNPAMVYALLEGTLDVDDDFEKDYAFGVGPAFGILIDLTSIWRIGAHVRAQRFGLGDAHSDGEIKLEQSVTLGRDSAIRLDLTRQREFDRYFNSGALSWVRYF